MNPNGYTIESLGPDVRIWQAARVLDCSRSTVSRMCHDGRLKAFKVGTGRLRNHWRIDTEHLLQYAKKKIA